MVPYAYVKSRSCTIAPLDFFTHLTIPKRPMPSYLSEPVHSARKRYTVGRDGPVARVLTWLAAGLAVGATTRQGSDHGVHEPLSGQKPLPVWLSGMLKEQAARAGAVSGLWGRRTAPAAASNSSDRSDPSDRSDRSRRPACTTLIDKEIDGTLSAGDAVELHLLAREMLAHRRKVAPLPFAEARKLRDDLLAKARRRPGE